MRSFTIPTAYTVIDKFTQPVRKMFAAHTQFAGSLESGLGKGERLFKRLTPTISETSKQMFAFARSAAIAAAVIGGITFSWNAIKEYDAAVASFRTIKGGSDKQFAPYQKAINEVAKDAKKMATDTAAAFEKIAGLNAKFADTATGIKQVAAASIVLSKASRDELGSSAENLVSIMNQFSLQASEANRTINVLAAGQAVGAANIKQTAESFVNFGSVASSANITLEESVALVQVLGKYSVFASEAGNKLKGSILRIQKAGLGYASGVFSINDALTEAKGKLDKLKTAKQKDAYLNKLFGAENISTGRILVSNIALFKEFTGAVTNTNEATKAAAINTDTLVAASEEMAAAWVNLITGSDKTSKALGPVKDTMKFVANNMETIVSTGFKILLFFAAWKVLLIATRVALIAYNVVLGITGALSGTASVAIGANAIALGAYKAALAVATAAQWALNVAMTANPIGLIIVAIAALIALVVAVIVKFNEWGAALSLFMGPLGFIVSLVMSLRRNWEMLTKAFREGGILAGLKAIGKVILDAVLMPVQQLIGIIADLTGAKWAHNAVANIEQFRRSLDLETADKLNEKEAERRQTAFRAAGGLTIDINNNTNGRMKTETSGDSLATIRTKSTWQPNFGWPAPTN